MLPPPSAAEAVALSQPESSTRGKHEAVTFQAKPSQEEVEAKVTWPRGIQHLALPLTQITSFLESLDYQSL